MRRDPAKAMQMLDLLAGFFDNGRRWTKYEFHDGAGNRCLLGAMRYLRVKMNISGDGTAYYLSAAQPQWRMKGIADFNDSRESYGQIRELIDRARAMATAELAAKQPAETAPPCFLYVVQFPVKGRQVKGQ
jgi:hypothetical protein